MKLFQTSETSHTSVTFMTNIDFRNYRYASYRNLYFFLYKRNVKGKNARLVMPSCLVDKVRSVFPNPDDEDYVGHLE